jgi:predicted DNA-binding transcriptional regulator
MRRNSLTEEDILEFVEKKGETTIWEISKELKVAYLSAWIKVNFLLREGKLIRKMKDGRVVICLPSQQ